MNEPLSRRARSIRPSATFALSARAKELKAQGKPVLDLSLGEPDLDTPGPIVEAAHQALRDRHFHYTPTPGIPALRKAVADLYAQRLRIPVEPGMVIATNGAKQALFNALTVVTDPGDRVGMLAPYWVSYIEQAHALGCEPVVIPCPVESGYRPDLDALKGELDRGMKILILNSPCNPTGAAYGREDMKAIVDLVRNSHTLLLSDEIYEYIVYGDAGHVSPLHVAPDLASRTCVVSGLSKSYAMTGWRVGFSVAPIWWSGGMTRLQGHATSNINAISQQAAITALANPGLVQPLLEVFRGRRSLVLDLLGSLDGVTALTPEGTFYLFMDLSAQLSASGPGQDDASLATWMLEEHHVALVPGSAFGAPGRLRLSFAASDAVLRESFERMASALISL